MPNSINSLKSCRKAGLSENTRLTDQEQKVLNDFFNSEVSNGLLKGTDPVIKSRDEIKNIVFSLVPVFTVDSEILDKPEANISSVQDLLVRSNDQMLFIGRLNGQIVTYVTTFPSLQQSMTFSVPVGKAIKWGQHIEKIKAKADKGEFFFFGTGFGYSVAYFKNEKLYWMRSPTIEQEFDENELLKSLKAGRQEYKDFVNKYKDGGVVPKH